MIYVVLDPDLLLPNAPLISKPSPAVKKLERSFGLIALMQGGSNQVFYTLKSKDGRVKVKQREVYSVRGGLAVFLLTPRLKERLKTVPPQDYAIVESELPLKPELALTQSLGVAVGFVLEDDIVVKSFDGSTYDPDFCFYDIDGEYEDE